MLKVAINNNNFVRDLLSGKLYHVKHHKDDDISMQHSIMRFANVYDATTGKKDGALILSSPLLDKKIRKQWKVTTIKQIVQFDKGIKLVLCSAYYKPTVQLEADLEFILFVPSRTLAECLEFICRNSCFKLAVSDEGTVYCKNGEHDKVCLWKNEIYEDTAVETTGTYVLIYT